MEPDFENMLIKASCRSDWTHLENEHGARFYLHTAMSDRSILAISFDNFADQYGITLDSYDIDYNRNHIASYAAKFHPDLFATYFPRQQAESYVSFAASVVDRIRTMDMTQLLAEIIDVRHSRYSGIVSSDEVRLDPFSFLDRGNSPQISERVACDLAKLLVNAPTE